MLLGHVTRPAWGPAYAAAAAAAAAYYRYAAASLTSPCSPSPFSAPFSPCTAYLGVSDPLRVNNPLTSVEGFCSSLVARGGDVDRCLKTIRCGMNHAAPLHSTPPTSWQRPRGDHQPHSLSFDVLCAVLSVILH